MYENAERGPWRKREQKFAPLHTVDYQPVSMVTQEEPDLFSRAGS